MTGSLFFQNRCFYNGEHTSAGAERRYRKNQQKQKRQTVREEGQGDHRQPYRRSQSSEEQPGHLKHQENAVANQLPGA